MTFNISEIFVPERIKCGVTLTSIKKMHEYFATLFAQTVPRLTSTEVFDALHARERLGSTGLGHGIALPHCRSATISAPVAALVTTKEGLIYDAPDDIPVDIFCALLVPEEFITSHLQILSKLATIFKNQELIILLRKTEQSEKLFQIMLQYIN